MPYKTCFIEDPSEASEALDLIVDAFFMVDIFVNFLSATERENGRIVNNPRIIATEYMRSWFLFDLLSVLPIDQLNKLIQFKSGMNSKPSEANAGEYN